MLYKIGYNSTSDSAFYTRCCDRASVLVRLLAAEPRSTTGLLFLYQYLCGSILVTPYSTVGSGELQQQGQCLFIALAARSLFVFFFAVFPFYYFILWVGIVGLMSSD